MAIKIGVAQVAMPTSAPTTADLTNSSAGFSSDLAAAILFSSNATANDTKTADSSMSIGVAGLVGGVTTLASIAEAGADGTEAERTDNDASSFITQRYNSSSKVDVGAFSSWLSNGLRLNFTTAQGRARLINALLIGGAGVEAAVLEFPFAGDTTGTARTISHGLSGAPVALIGISNGLATSSSTVARLHMGFFANSVAAGIGWRAQFGAGVQQMISSASASKWSFSVNPTTDYIVPSVTASDVTLTVTLASGTTTQTWYVLAIYAPGTSAKAGIFTTPGGSPQIAQSITAQGFAPSGLLMVPSRLQTVEALVQTDPANCFGIGAAAYHGGTVSQGSTATTGDDAAATDIRKDWTSIAKVLRAPNDDGNELIVATVSSFDADGISLDYSGVGSGEKVAYLTFGAPAVGGQPFSGKFGGKLRGKLG